jgi:hypothetical protein
MTIETTTVAEPIPADVAVRTVTEEVWPKELRQEAREVTERLRYLIDEILAVTTRANELEKKAAEVTEAMVDSLEKKFGAQLDSESVDGVASIVAHVTGLGELFAMLEGVRPD